MILIWRQGEGQGFKDNSLGWLSSEIMYSFQLWQKHMWANQNVTWHVPNKVKLWHSQKDKFFKTCRHKSLCFAPVLCKCILFVLLPSRDSVYISIIVTLTVFFPIRNFQISSLFPNPSWSWPPLLSPSFDLPTWSLFYCKGMQSW